MCCLDCMRAPEAANFLDIMYVDDGHIQVDNVVAVKRLSWIMW